MGQERGSLLINLGSCIFFFFFFFFFLSLLWDNHKFYRPMN